MDPQGDYDTLCVEDHGTGYRIDRVDYVPPDGGRVMIKMWYRFTDAGVQFTTDPAELRDLAFAVSRNGEPVAWDDVAPFDFGEPR